MYLKIVYNVEMQYSDTELVQQYLKGEEKALRELFERYLDPVYNFVYRYVGNSGDASDITQDVFLAVWKNLKKFDQNKKFKTWIFEIAKNTSLNWIKKKKPYLFSDFENEKGDNYLAQTIADAALPFEEVFSRSESANKIAMAMAKLNPDYQKVVKMHNFEELTFKEISTYLGKSLNTVKSQYRRAILELKKILN